jgi:hypothetical protein
VDGWWVESEPVDLTNLSDKDFARLLAELEKRAVAHGMTPEAYREFRRKVADFDIDPPK